MSSYHRRRYEMAEEKSNARGGFGEREGDRQSTVGMTSPLFYTHRDAKRTDAGTGESEGRGGGKRRTRYAVRSVAARRGKSIGRGQGSGRGQTVRGGAGQGGEARRAIGVGGRKRNSGHVDAKFVRGVKLVRIYPHRSVLDGDEQERWLHSIRRDLLQAVTSALSSRTGRRREFGHGSTAALINGQVGGIGRVFRVWRWGRTRTASVEGEEVRVGEVCEAVGASF
ncbi:hypothetical protein AXG93_868s1420 [Marchantia polymorpha subsp. ruderalis]|uniref:Uncharacterized protein n=1 Tax=Marchantia polymorpha subsp. ruderalis TaxID=1480154 RepID=A0A176VK51_MARPO|nr:hypothetical protein AXG93_868s1420 [Marchantia polymorpha subsp. ruderalis]